MTENATFGTWLRQQRRQRDLTQAALAAQVGCATVTIKKFEADQRRPSRQMASRLAECLDFPEPDWDTFIQAARAGHAPAFQPRGPARIPGVILPAPRSAFFGRTNERDALTTLLSQEEVRLVTVIGPPGVGKTRFALQTAWELADQFQHGAVWIDFASVTTADEIFPAIRQSLGIRELVSDEISHLREWLYNRQLLLVLDNCEQITGAGVSISTLLNQAASLKLLLTSQVPLDIYGEHLLPLEPLPLPGKPASLTSIRNNPALALFQARARAVQVDFSLHAGNAETVNRICTQLDGLPLAIELAAGQLRYATLQEIAARMHQRLDVLQAGPVDWRPRHQTFRAAIDWSTSLLSEEQQRHFARLGIFVEGFSAAAAAALGTQDSLQHLVSANLVQNTGENRFALLQTLRDYALECLEASDEWERTHREHTQYFCQLAGAASDHHFTASISEWQRRLNVERSNIRAALDWCHEHDPVLGLELAANMWKLWYLWGQYRTGAQSLGQFLGQVKHPSIKRARALRGRGVLLSRYGEFEQALPLFEESLRIARQHQDGYSIASALMGLGDSYNALGGHSKAFPYYQEALTHFEAVGDPRGSSWALGGLADVAYKKEDNLPRAIELMAKCVHLARQADDPRHLAWMLSIAADLDVLNEKPTHAQQRLTEAHTRFTEVGDFPGVAYANLRLGALALHAQQQEKALTQLEKALQLARETFTVSYEAQALCLLGMLALQDQHYERGIRYCAMASARHRFLRKRLLTPDLTLLDQLLETAQTVLGHSRYDELWQQSYREYKERTLST